MAKRTTTLALAFGVVLAAIWAASAAPPDAPPAPPELPAPGAGSSPDATGSAAPLAAPVVDGGSERDDDTRPAVAREAVPASTARPQRRPVGGRVLLASGLPAAGADVRIAWRHTTADQDGAFRSECDSDGDALVATLPGNQPAVIAAVATRPEVVEGRELTVVLAGPALTITGWLVGADGSPCQGWHVDLHGGGTDCGHDGLPKLSAEDLAAGATALTIEQSMSTGPAPANPNDQRIGADGSFTIGGLRAGRDYVLRARNESTLQTVRSLPIHAGTQGHRFVVPEGSWRERVHGRTIDRRGGAIAGVRVRLTMRVHRSGNGESYQTGQEVRTDADGRFVFQHVPREDLLLRFDQADVESLYHEFRADDPGEDLLIPLSSQCRFRCEPAAHLLAPTSLRVLDEGQRPLRLEQQVREGQSTGGRRLDLPAGGGEFTVSDRAAWLVLEAGEQEVRRLPLRLRRGEVTIVRG